MTQSSDTSPTRSGRGPGGGAMTVLGGLLVLLLSLLAGTAVADDIVTWTDDQGITHFGNARLAPTEARRVEVAPANGMDTPETPATRGSAGRPAMILIERQPNREAIGWRGHEWNVKRRRHR